MRPSGLALSIALALLLFTAVAPPAGADDRPIGTASGSGDDSGLRPFTLQDGLSLTPLAGRVPIDLSPDGRLLAYTVQRPLPREEASDRRYTTTGVPRSVAGCEVWVSDLASGGHRRLMPADSSDGPAVTSWGPRWSPDGSMLAFFSDATGAPRLTLWRPGAEDRLDGALLPPVDGAVVRSWFGFEGPRWTADGAVLFRALSAPLEHRFRAVPAGWPAERALESEEQERRALEQLRGEEGGPVGPVTVFDARPRAAASARSGEGQAAGGEAGEKGEKGADGAAPRDRGVIDIVRYEPGSSRLVRLLTERAVRSFEISPDGERVAVSVQLGLEREGAQQPLFALYVVPADRPAAAGGETAPVRPLVPRFRNGYGISFSWSPDSTKLAWATVGPLAEGDLWVADATTGESRNLTAELPPLSTSLETYDPPFWLPAGHPGGDALLWLSGSSLWRVPLAVDEQPVELVADPTLHFGTLMRPAEEATAWVVPAGAIGAGIPAPEPSEGDNLWMPRDRPGVIAKTFDRESRRGGLAWLPIDRGTGAGSEVEPAPDKAVPIATFLRSLGGFSRFNVEVDRERRKLFFRAQSAERPEELWALDLEFAPPQGYAPPPGFVRGEQLLPGVDPPLPVSDLNPHLSGIDLGRVETVSWRGLGGEELSGLLLLPAGASEGNSKSDPLPMVAIVYAGDRPSHARYSFGLGSSPTTSNPRLFLAAGFAVLIPDLPLVSDNPMADIPAQLLPGLDAAVATGLVDPDRLGVFGHSYGGYTVNALVTQTDRFAAAVSSTGMANLTSGYAQSYFETGGTGWFETGQGGMDGTVWDETERYIANSPYFQLDRVTTPLLLVHGTEDDAYTQSVEMYAGLKRLGKPVALARYNGAGHWYGDWTSEQLEDFWTRVIGWFGEYLGGDANF